MEEWYRYFWLLICTVSTVLTGIYLMCGRFENAIIWEKSIDIKVINILILKLTIIRKAILSVCIYYIVVYILNDNISKYTFCYGIKYLFYVCIINIILCFVLDLLRKLLITLRDHRKKREKDWEEEREMMYKYTIEHINDHKESNKESIELTKESDRKDTAKHIGG